MTRYWYYYYDYYYERICLLTQHAESSTDHLGLSRACLDLDYRHAKTGSQSPLGQRCLTHPIHRCRGHVALLSIEKQKPHSDVFILKVPKSFFIPEKKWFFKEEKKKKNEPWFFPRFWSIKAFTVTAFVSSERINSAQTPEGLDWCHFWRSTYTLN